MKKLLPCILITLTGVILLSACSGSKSAQQTGTTVSVPVPKSKKGVDSAVVERMFIDACKFIALDQYDEAVDLLDEIIKEDPLNAPSFYQLAKIFIDHGQANDALIYSKRAVDIDPSNKAYGALYAGILGYTGQFQKAAEVYEDMIKNGHNDIDTYYQLADTYDRAGNQLSAITTLLEIQKLYGVDEQLAFELQHLYAAEGQFGKAVEWCETLVKIAPDNTLYRRYLSDYYDRNGQPDLAEKTFEALLELDPSNTDLQFKKADMQLKAGDKESYLKTMEAAFGDPKGNIDTKIFYLVLFVDSIGRKEFEQKDKVFGWTEKLVEAHPEDAKAYAMRGDYLYYDAQLQAAANAYNKSLALRNDVFDVWLKMFYIYADLKKYDSLFEYTNMAIELYPNQPVSYYFGGIAANQLERYEDAVKTVRRGLPLSFSNLLLRANMFSIMGDAYHALKNYPESDQAYENSLKLNPDDAYTLNNYAYYLSLRGEQLERAAELAKHANDVNPNDASLEDTYGWVLYQQGKYADAKKWIEKALSNGGDKSGVIREHYGDVLYKLGDTAGALEQWKLAKQAGEASDLLDKKIAEGKLFE